MEHTDPDLEETYRALEDLCRFADEAVAEMQQRQEIIRALAYGRR
jgi:hypothetical protein